MPATAGSTTIELPVPLKARLAKLRKHDRQAYHEVIAQALDAFEMRTGERGLDALVAQHAAGLRKAARRNGITKLWLIGSRARGEARPDSDVDLLYRAPSTTDIWMVSGFLADAEELVGRRVDLVDIDHLPERLRRAVDEAVPL